MQHNIKLVHARTQSGVGNLEGVWLWL